MPRPRREGKVKAGRWPGCVCGAAMLVVAAAACGGRVHGDGTLAEPPADASSLDAPPDSTFAYPIGDDAAAADSSFEAPPSPDAIASDAGDASDSTGDSPAVDASKPHVSCDDACALGDQECSPLPQVCTYDDAGFTVSCASQGQGIWTCVVGDTGCTVWARGVACRPDVPCCVACQSGICPLGSEGDPCEQDTDCASDACDALSNRCVSSQCADHRQDGLEADIDCGGSLCNSCGGGQRCRSNGDCQPGHACFSLPRVCSGASASTPDASASDAAEASSPCVDTCTLGDQECSLLPQVCTYDDAGFTASCKAPGEGIWTCVVGGGGCTVWAPGPACGSTFTCCGGCQQVACDASPGLCWSCPAGSDGKPCEQDTDCASNACDAVSHACISDQCADHRRDGLETDVDCGGPLCSACTVGQGCQSNRDCRAGHVCLNNGYAKSCT
jgi:hypothetical protein